MKRSVIIPLLGILLASFVATANASTTITFDEFPLGTLISDQYEFQGVIFGPGDLTPRLPQCSMNGAMPDQPVLRPTGEPDFYIFQGDFWMFFPRPATSVQFDSGYWDDAGVGIIEAYDKFMNLVGTFTNPGTGVQPIDISGVGEITAVYFNSIADGAGADIDNLVVQACTYSYGYWKNHSVYGPATPADDGWYTPAGPFPPGGAGPDAALFDSGLSWYEAMHTAPRGGNAWFPLAHQWTAAYLNFYTGSGAGGVDVVWLLNEGAALLDAYDQYDSGSPLIPKKTYDRDYAEFLTHMLDYYNNGYLGPGHCSQ